MGGTLMDCILLRRIAQGAILAIYIAAWTRELASGAWRLPAYSVPWGLTIVFLLVLGVVSVADLPAVTKAVFRRNGKK